MKLIRFRHDGAVRAGILTAEGIFQAPENDVLSIIRNGALEKYERLPGPAIPFDSVTPLLPYDVPPKIWCIGLNYKSHAEDISSDVDAEGELAIVIGKTCKHVATEDVPKVIFGYTTTLDLTALDILKKNPRYLTRAKSMDTFFSFGPVIVTADEIADVNALEVITEHNGGICSRDFVRNMKHGPHKLVSFHSEHMTLHPGDIISTGCPKGARIKAGDKVRARIDGIGTLGATVTQGRRIRYT
jgi:2-keto-4-pentenoate hydratase/2-oxohepta-3-ene-1,7-dioic acid hydratase in catechol pathway